MVRDDILYKAKLKSIQQVKSRLGKRELCAGGDCYNWCVWSLAEMVAWSKYVRGLKNTQRPSRNHACYLTAGMCVCVCVCVCEASVDLWTDTLIVQ